MYVGFDDLQKVVKRVFKDKTVTNIVAFTGDLGTGKTSLIKKLCEELSVVDAVSSPTFSLVNEYMSSKGDTVYHFDFYRIENSEEAEAIGLDDYLFSGNLCLIEWPEVVEPFLPKPYLEVHIDYREDNLRNYEFITHG